MTDQIVSEVTICNQALNWLGQDRISSLDDNTTAAKLCRANYQFIRDAVMETRMWTFATTRAISETTDIDDWGTSYVHSVPLNWLGVYRAYVSAPRSITEGVVDQSYRKEGRNILSSRAKLYLWGIQKVTDTQAFSPLFTQALAARLAADFAIPLTENRLLQADMWALYEAKLAEAAVRDGQQGGNDYVTQRTLTNARYYGNVG